jgi:thioredoxin 1
MKQALIVFIIALALGSFINSLMALEHSPGQETASISSPLVIQGSDKNFKQEVLESDKPVLVDFFATWCGPCKMMAPVVDQLAKEYEGRVKVVKVDTDQSPESSETYRIQAIPAFIVFKDGKVVQQIVGAAPKEELVSALDKVAKVNSASNAQAQ